MDKLQFANWMQAVYACFSKAQPSPAALKAVWQRVESLPDGFFDFAKERLEDYTALPVNLGRELKRVIWPEYLERYPQLKARENTQRCRDCDPDNPGMFWAWDVTGKRWYFKCRCNNRPDQAHMQSWSRQQALNAGYLLSDPFAPKAPRHLSPTIRAAIGNNNGPRRDHLRQVEEYNADQRRYDDTANW